MRAGDIFTLRSPGALTEAPRSALDPAPDIKMPYRLVLRVFRNLIHPRLELERWGRERWLVTTGEACSLLDRRRNVEVSPHRSRCFRSPNHPTFILQSAQHRHQPFQSERIRVLFYYGVGTLMWNISCTSPSRQGWPGESDAAIICKWLCPSLVPVSD